MDRDDINEQSGTSSDNEGLFAGKKDVFVVAILLFLGIILLFLITKLQKTGAKVVVSIDREEYMLVSLDEDGVYPISTEYGNNTLVVEAGKAYVSEADCPDKICKHYDPISKTTESIVCIPHKLIISIEE